MLQSDPVQFWTVGAVMAGMEAPLFSLGITYTF
jgi:hypothetical protein